MLVNNYENLFIFLQDVNECSAADHTCQRDDLCDNVIGGYTCRCLPGYKSDANDNDQRKCIRMYI